ncbi:TPA: hypothetical protein HA278_00075, partial [Candidatus Woesearchaeota archaeon]|nr:hypothetical protein [Candidatus Woesearchaeota archaeon]
AIGLLQLATLPIRLHWKLVKDIFETRGNPIALVERYGYEAAQTKEALLETLTNLDRVYATEKNRWFDERSSFAAGIHDYESECSDVTLNKGYTVGYGEGFVASQVALLLVPVTKLSWLSKFKILLKFKSFGKLAGKGAKIFDKVGELKWLSTLPDDQARVLTEKVAQIAAREGKDVARGVAKTRALYEQGAGAERIVAELKKVPGVKQGDNFPNKPVQKIKIENFYGHSNDDVANTLMQASHQDIKDPILLVRIGDKYMINDGVGRTTRAIWKGETEINAKIIKNYDHLSDLKFQAGLSDEGRIHLRNWEKFSEKIDIDETKRLLE